MRTVFAICAFLLIIPMAVAQDEESPAREDSEVGAEGAVEGGAEDLGSVPTAPSVDELVGRLGVESWVEREAATSALYERGEKALDVLEKAIENADGEVRWRVERLSWMIRWRVSPGLLARLGALGEDLMSGNWRERKRGIRYLEAFGGEEALEALRRFALADESIAVRRHALEASTRLGIRLEDPMAFETYIFIRSGSQYLEQGQYEEAIKDYLTALSIDPDNALAYYNLACAYSRRGEWDDVDLALEALGKALKYGFRDFEHIEKDRDLDAIRGDPRFSRLIEKHMPDEE